MSHAGMREEESAATSTTEEEELLQEISALDEEAAQLQGEPNRLAEALAVLERALVLRTRVFGVQSDEVSAACKALAEFCNLQAIGELARGDFRSSLELLKKAQILTERHPLVRAVTFNNFACYYRRLVLKLKTFVYQHANIPIFEPLACIAEPANFPWRLTMRKKRCNSSRTKRSICPFISTRASCSVASTNKHRILLVGLLFR